MKRVACAYIGRGCVYTEGMECTCMGRGCVYARGGVYVHGEKDEGVECVYMHGKREEMCIWNVCIWKVWSVHLCI